VAQCANGFEAVKAVAELTPDLLLLDVQMPKLDGFEVLDLVGRDVAVVFTTAYDQYALRAFEVHAVDYLLKPISAERLSEALARVRERLGRGERATSPGAMAAARPREGHANRVLVRDGPRVHVIPVDTIDYVQAQDDYVCFRSEGKDYLKEQTLADVETSLDPKAFVRIHRSYLLNLARLVRVDQDERENRVAVLTDGRRLPVSRAGYTRLNSLL
jgi:two-component system LytT family response regulator